MDRLYQRTFDRVHLPEDRARSLRAQLASQCSPMKQEVIPMKQHKSLRRPAVVLVAALLVCALSVTAFAYGGRVVEHVYHLMAGGIVEHGIDEAGNAYASGTASLDGAAAPVEVRADGRLYLVVQGEDTDITGQCSYTTPYIYECTGEDGLRHAFIVGGDPDAIGWAEFLWDENGLPAAGNAFFGTSGGPEDAPWLDAGKEQLGLPW